MTEVKSDAHRYELGPCFAKGGMGKLHLAHRIEPDGSRSPVAIKQMLPQLADDPDFMAQFFREARICLQLRHPNIVRTLDWGMSEDGPFLVMAYEGLCSLEELVQRHEDQSSDPIAMPISLHIIRGILDALCEAHLVQKDGGQSVSPIIHRDISPSNILLTQDGRPLLCDFGLAKSLDATRLTKPGQIKGKVAYMSPEQARGSDQLGPQTDIFSLGIVFWELLCAQRLFRLSAKSADHEVLGRITAEKYPIGRVSTFNPEVSDKLEAIVSKMLKRDLQLRYPSARAVRDDLDALGDQQEEGKACTKALLEDLFGQEGSEALSIPIELSGLDGSAKSPNTQSARPQPILGNKPDIAPKILKVSKRKPDVKLIGIALFSLFLGTLAIGVTLGRYLANEKDERVAAVPKAHALPIVDVVSAAKKEAPEAAVDEAQTAGRSPRIEVRKKRWRPKLRFERTRFFEGHNDEGAVQILGRLKKDIRRCFFIVYPSKEAYDGRILVVYLRLESTGGRYINVNSRLPGDTKTEYVGGLGAKMAACVQKRLDKLKSTEPPDLRLLGALDVFIDPKEAS